MHERSFDLDELLAQQDWILGLARGLLADPHGAEDLVQESYLAALQAPPRRSETLRSWLATVVRRQAYRKYRHVT